MKKKATNKGDKCPSCNTGILIRSNNNPMKESFYECEQCHKAFTSTKWFIAWGIFTSSIMTLTATSVYPYVSKHISSGYRALDLLLLLLIPLTISDIIFHLVIKKNIYKEVNIQGNTGDGSMI